MSHSYSPPLMKILLRNRGKRRWYWSVVEMGNVVDRGGPLGAHDIAFEKARDVKDIRLKEHKALREKS